MLEYNSCNTIAEYYIYCSMFCDILMSSTVVACAVLDLA